MRNSKGSYPTTPEKMMAAFDELPPSARKALADAVENWVSQPVLTRWRRGQRGYRNGREIAERVAEWDRKEDAKIEAKRGRK